MIHKVNHKHMNHMNLKKILKKNFIKFNIHENFIWIFSIKEKYCNETDSVNKYYVLIKHSILEHMILFHFYVMNWFFKTVWETIKCYIWQKFCVIFYMILLKVKE